jgi:chromosome segregation ATPase
MTEENELTKLEGFVSSLLEKYNDLQGNNKKLNERIERRDASIVGLEDEIASMKDERGEISSRVSGLIGKIEEWEATTADAETSVSVEKNSEDAEFEAEAEEDKTESGVQGNLFSVEASGE